MGWIVKLVKSTPRINGEYPLNYFPRKFHYKREANLLKIVIERKGGEVVVERD